VQAASNRLAGFAQVLTDRVYRRTAHHVIVASDLRGQDLGKRLMDAVIAHPDLRNIESLELHCLLEMEVFYAKWGFARNTTGALRLARMKPIA
jgi:predicted GNAT family N-acyltransferase